MYIEDKPLYVNLRPKPKPIFPQIKIPPFDVLKHFLAKLALLKNHFLGKLNFFGGIFGRPPKKQLYKPKPGYRPSRPSYKPRPNHRLCLRRSVSAIRLVMSRRARERERR